MEAGQGDVDPLVVISYLLIRKRKQNNRINGSTLLTVTDQEYYIQEQDHGFSDV